jgi:20S proteasome alpha/beta subunit
VTIVAGVMCPDGIVLAADSQETVGDSLKVFKPKLVELRLISPDLKAVIVASGNGTFVDVLVERISEQLDLANPYIAPAKQAIQQAVTQVCAEIWPHYTSQVDKPEARLIIGLRAIDGLTMLDAFVPMVKTADPYAFIGWGGSLATYKAKQMSLAGLPVEVTVNLIVHILDVVKDNVEFCGGPTRLAVITADGGVEHKDQQHLTDVAKAYKAVAWLLDRIPSLLPVLMVPDGTKTLLTAAAEIKADDFIEMEKHITETITTLQTSRMNSATGLSDPAKELAEASASLAAGVQALQTTVLKLHKVGLIPKESHMRISESYAEAAKAGLQANLFIQKGDLGSARLSLVAAFCHITIPISNQQLIAQASKGQQ